MGARACTHTHTHTCTQAQTNLQSHGHDQNSTWFLLFFIHHSFSTLLTFAHVWCACMHSHTDRQTQTHTLNHPLSPPPSLMHTHTHTHTSTNQPLITWQYHSFSASAMLAFAHVWCIVKIFPPSCAFPYNQLACYKSSLILSWCPMMPYEICCFIDKLFSTLYHLSTYIRHRIETFPLFWLLFTLVWCDGPKLSSTVTKRSIKSGETASKCHWLSLDMENHLHWGVENHVCFCSLLKFWHLYCWDLCHLQFTDPNLVNIWATHA